MRGTGVGRLASIEGIGGAPDPRYIEPMDAPPKIPRPKLTFFVGWAFGFRSPKLGFDFFGSPLEIVQKLKQAGIDPAYAAHHVDVELRVAPVCKDGRIGKFSGGPNAPGVMRLLDAMVTKDWDEARRVLAEYPTLLSAADELASVPLCLNAALGQAETVKFLLVNGAAVNGAGKLGMTALHWAAVHGEAAIARMLVDAEADASARSWFFLTPANLAHANCRTEVLRLLAPGAAAEAARVRIEAVMEAMGCDPGRR